MAAHRQVSRDATNALESMIRIYNTFYALLVTTVYPYSARGPGRRRGRKPQIPAACRIHPPARIGHLLLFVSWPALDSEDHEHRPPGNGQIRAGLLSSCAQSA